MLAYHSEPKYLVELEVVVLRTITSVKLAHDIALTCSSRSRTYTEFRVPLSASATRHVAITIMSVCM